MLTRHALLDAVQKLVEQAARAHERLAIMVVRLHGLREISLRFGYQHGEQAEQNARDVLERSLRPFDQVFAAGDGCFVVVLPHMRNDSHALLGAARVVRAFEEPLGNGSVSWAGRPVLGIALFPEHGAGAELLCRRAEMAHDEARRRGEPIVRYALGDTPVEFFYDELREAIESNRLRVHFQPLWDLQTQSVVGAESLARWTSAKHGDISPASFIPFAELSDLISTLTRWSIHATLRHASVLGEATPLTFAVNFSPRVIGESGLVEQLLGALDIWRISPTSVVAEITETALINDLDQSVRVLKRLRDHGVRVAIDDFGTGYASFSYLRQLPATELKIDKSLVIGIRDDARSAKLVKAMIDMAHHLDLAAIAEGIEDAATQNMLTDMGCDFGQGYHLGRPEPATDFIARFILPTPSKAP